MLQVDSGVTDPQDWKDYDGDGHGKGIFVDVDTSGSEFLRTPHYVVTLLAGQGGAWITSGASSVASATPTGFRVYLRWADLNQPAQGDYDAPLDAATARGKDWQIQWTGILT